MKKLLSITVLGLVIGFSNSSFAVNFVDTNAKTPESPEVFTEITGGKVESSPMSFYFDPAQKGSGRKHSAEVADNDEPTLFVFGVRL